jgi:hypothetical protein
MIVVVALIFGGLALIGRDVWKWADQVSQEPPQ